MTTRAWFVAVVLVGFGVVVAGVAAVAAAVVAVAAVATTPATSTIPTITVAIFFNFTGTTIAFP